MNKFEIRQGDCLERLREIADGSVHCCVTSPPYFGLRSYGTEAQVWGGDSNCEHDWKHSRYYVEGGGGARSSIEAFSEPGEANAERIKAARWREDDTCSKCGAWRGHFGLEPTPDLYVQHAVAIFREVRRVLKDDGTLWLNLGDSFAANGTSGLSVKGASSTLVGTANAAHTAQKKIVPPGCKPKDLIGIPWMVAFALRADGWYLRSDIIWHKPNPMPESVTDRPTKAHEYIFLLSKSERYYYDADAIAEPVVAGFNGSTFTQGKTAAPRQNVGQGPRNDGETRNKRSVWTVTTKPFSEAHFATFPPDLIKPCILAGCPEGGTVLDPFNGAGTTGVVALRNGRHYIGLELNPEYVEMSRRRILSDSPLFNQEVA